MSMIRGLFTKVERFWTASIRRQLILGIIAVHAVLMSIFVFDLVHRQQEFLSSQGVAQTTSLAETLAANSTSWVLADDVLGLEEIVESQSKYPGLQYAMVVSPLGRVLAHSDRRFVGKFLADANSKRLIGAEHTPQTLNLGKDLIDIAAPVLANGQHIGWARVAISLDDVNKSLQIVTRDGIIYTIVAIAIGILFAYLLARGLTHTLSHMASVAQELRNKGSRQRIQIIRNDELGVLAKTLNNLADVLHDRESELRLHRDNLEKLVEERTSSLENEIKERKQVERALKNSEERTRMLINSAGDGIVSTDKDGNIVLFNNAAEKIFGYSVVEVMGKNVKTLLPAAAAANHDSHIRNFTTTNRPYVLGDERRIYAKTKSDELIPVEIAISTLHFDEEQTFTAIVRDITARIESEDHLKETLSELKQSQKRQQRSEKRIRQILDSAPAGISVLNNGTTKRSYANQKFFEMFGVNSLKEIEEFGFARTFVNQEDCETAKQCIESGKGFSRFVMQRRNVHGDSWWALLDAIPIEFDGKPSTIVWHLDITDQKLAEAEIAQVEKMASLGALVAGVAHEVNTPIGVSVTAISHLKEQTDALNKSFSEGRMTKSALASFIDVATQSTSIIYSNLYRAADLIRSFKQVAVDQSGDGLREFNLLDYIHEVSQSLEPQFKRNPGLTVSIDGDPGLEMGSYPGPIAQILTNLVMNSVLHGFPDGEGGEISVRATSQGSMARLLYKDTGRGISADNLPRIFDPFFTTNRAKGGSGLGMHVVYNLVTRKLGGTIKCSSEPGKGVVFEILVPLKMRHDPEEQAT
ncbi:PAS domain S-box protein [Hwanghaeella sp.]|uniref:PAS domain S-box protein n=1 Tax=Hwanghaeella sp. TaxID=2605943 RepID=UPI003CCC3760